MPVSTCCHYFSDITVGKGIKRILWLLGIITFGSINIFVNSKEKARGLTVLIPFNRKPTHKGLCICYVPVFFALYPLYYSVVPRARFIRLMSFFFTVLVALLMHRCLLKISSLDELENARQNSMLTQGLGKLPKRPFFREKRG